MDQPYRVPGERVEDVFKQDRDWGELFKMTFAIAFFVSLGLGFATLILGPILATVFVSGKADYCYVEPETYNVPDPESRGYNCGHHTDGYTLKQHVPWRSDRSLARQLKSPDEARQEAAKYGCEIR
jgi:hypothetical protein